MSVSLPLAVVHLLAIFLYGTDTRSSLLKFQFLCNSLDFACSLAYEIVEIRDLALEMSRKVAHVVSWLFGKSTTPKELLRKNQRVLNRAVRDMDRERVKMEMQEKKIISDIKKMAKEGQIVSTLTGGF